MSGANLSLGFMNQAPDGLRRPTSHYCTIQGRAAEIARAQGSPAVGPEHLFLGMLHDGGWPVSVIGPLVDLDRAEEAVIGILSGPGYAPPSPARFKAGDCSVPLWGLQAATDMGDAFFGAEHALLEMIRRRDTVPARALAALADLDALEAAVLEARSAAEDGRPAVAVDLPEGQQMDGPLAQAIAGGLPEGAKFGFNSDGDGRTWVCVIGADGGADTVLTRQVLNAALAGLGGPPVPGT